MGSHRKVIRRFLILLISVAVVSFASVVPLAVPTFLRFTPPLSLVLPPITLPQPPPSLVLLHPPTLTHTPPPQAPAANIIRKEKYVVNQTGGGEARWSIAGGSASRGNSPIRPLVVVGEKHQPAPVLTPTPKVEPSALLAGIAALTRPGKQASGA